MTLYKGHGERSRTHLKIAVVGAGFTGLSSALYLLKKNHRVTIFEKEKVLGGLVAGFKQKDWTWTIEKHYHHWFTNDKYALDLIDELGLKKDLLIPTPLTSVYYKNKSYPFNSAIDVITFPHLSLTDRIRCGAVLAYLKILPAFLAVNLEKYTAYNWLTRFFGKNTFRILWQPLLDGKFGKYAKTVNMAWFWARIKKRTSRLTYLKGGYQNLMAAMAKKIQKSGGKIYLNKAFDAGLKDQFDKIIFTAPSFIFTQTFKGLPALYNKKLQSIPHLFALNLLLITKNKLLSEEYWLNINDRKIPFIGIVAHTNFIDKKYYGGKNLTWIANYLAPDHPYLKMSKEELFAVYKPYLQKINPYFNFQSLTTKDYQLFHGPFAQPVFGIDYSKIKPEFKTPVKNVYLANMDMIYPWDRGTNYAIELGYKVAEYIENN